MHFLINSSYFQKVGCDWVVDSSAEEDICGVCKGTGSICDTIKGVYDKQGYSGYKEVTAIPSGSRNIRIEEMDHSVNYISIGSETSKNFYLNGKR